VNTYQGSEYADHTILRSATVKLASFHPALSLQPLQYDSLDDHARIDAAYNYFRQASIAITLMALRCHCERPMNVTTWPP
jgi:hypothetical protein